MKLKQTLLIVAFLSANFLIAQCPNLVWSDEFDGNALNEDFWNFQLGDGSDLGIPGWGNNELQYYRRENVEVSEGTLKITARAENFGGKAYTSARINSKNKADFTYGRYEASIKLPYGNGLWPAFWMLSSTEQYGGWPQSGEIDIMEFVASKPEEIFGTIHYGNLWPNNQFQGRELILEDADFPENFHVFAIEWEPGEIRWYMDDILYSVKKTLDVAPFRWPFDHDFHFLLNVAVGGNLGGAVANGMLPATMEIDYVRVYDGFLPYLNGEPTVSNRAQEVSYTVENYNSDNNVIWSVPEGATITSGQGTKTITVNFGAEGGEIKAFFNDGCENREQVFQVKVEKPFGRTTAFENFDDQPNALFNTTTGTLREVNNPQTDVVNNSAIVGEYTRNGNERFDLLVYNTTSISSAVPFLTGDQKFFMDVLTDAPTGTEILLQLETSAAQGDNFPNGRHSRYVATVTENGKWHRLEFSLLDRPDASAANNGIQKMILLFASNTFTSDTYYFDNLDSYGIIPNSDGNIPPSAAITSPASGSILPKGSTVTVEVAADDEDGSIAQVEFFVDGSALGVDNSAPFSYDLIVPTGTASISAIATDDEGKMSTASIIGITGPAGDIPTSVLISELTVGRSFAGNYEAGTALVKVIDDLGFPVANAVVNGTFSGTINERVESTTGDDGVAFFQTFNSEKGGLLVNFCVESVDAELPYTAQSNLTTCTSGSTALPNLGRLPINLDDLSEQNRFSVFPNPAEDALFIRYTEDIPIETVEVYSLDGKLMINTRFEANQRKLDVSNLKKGIYWIRAIDANGNRFATRMVK
ncbi:MAG: family 16 glycosylhydrolase [Bacteroidota bacterium]